MLNRRSLRPCGFAALALSAAALLGAADERPREPADSAGAVSIRLHRAHTVFSSGERVSGHVDLDRLQQGEVVEQVTLQWRLTPADSTAVLLHGTHTVRLQAVPNERPAVPFEFALPAVEGVYDLQITVAAGAGEPRKAAVRIVVISPVPPARAPTEPGDLRLVDSFSPAGGAAPIASGPLPESSAFRLRTGRTGFPHRVIASLFSRDDDDLGMTILDSAPEHGLVRPAEVSLTPVLPENPAALKTREFIFWPRTDQPLLIVQHPGRVAAKSPARVELFELPSLPAPSPRASLDSELPSRWVGPYLSDPDIRKHFGTASPDEQSTGGADDWVPVHTAANRLVGALHASGANSLLLAVLADEASHDRGLLLRPAQPGPDLSRCDVVELLYRLFEREKLNLVPELQFSGPLPALEALRDSAKPEFRGVELIGRDGRSWREHDASPGGSGPLYNPLHPSVQEAVLAGLREFVQRYASHEGFRAVAVRLSPEGYLRFPSLEWGYDSETVSRFERETRLAVPAGPAEDRYQRRYEFLTGPARGQWLRWRAAELAAFHQRMADVVTAAKPGARLVLSEGGPLREHGTPADFFLDAGVGDQERRSLPGLRGTHDSRSRERLAHALAAADVQMAFSADWLVTRGNAPGSSDLRRTLQGLPAIPFHRHEPVPQPVVVRVARAGNKTFLYALNEFPGPVSLDIQLSCPPDTSCRSLGLSVPLALEKGAASGSTLRFRLEPFSLWAGAVAAPHVQITGVAVAVDESARAYTQSRISQFSARVTEIQQAGRPSPAVHSVPVNLEESQTATSIAVPPNETILWQWNDRPDDQITLTSGRMEPGSAGRHPLTVIGLVARADADSTPLRVVLSGDQSDDTRSVVVPLQANRSRTRYSFACKAFAPEEQATLRIENRGTAPVWVDAVELRTYRITPDDLRELTKTVSALSLAWEERRYADCHRLLESDWGRLPFSEQAVSSRLAERAATPAPPVQP